MELGPRPSNLAVVGETKSALGSLSAAATMVAEGAKQAGRALGTLAAQFIDSFTKPPLVDFRPTRPHLLVRRTERPVDMSVHVHKFAKGGVWEKEVPVYGTEYFDNSRYPAPVLRELAKRQPRRLRPKVAV